MRARLAIGFLVLFVALDLVLVAMAFRHTSPNTPAAAQPPPSASQTPSPSPSPSKDKTPDTADSAASGPMAAQGPTYVDVSSAGVVLLASRGDCDASQPPVVAVSTNQGKRFRDRPVEGLAEVLRVQVQPDGSLLVVGRADGCEVASWTSRDAGRSWSRVDGAPRAWYLPPGQRQRAVFSPEGRRSTPCAPVSVSTVGVDVVRLLCPSGQVLGTSDGGTSWVPLGRLEGAVSARFTSVGDGVAVAVQDGCPAAVMETADGGTTWTRQVCLEGGRPRAVGANGDVVVAQVGDVVDVSTDGGDTWPGVSG